VGRGCTVARLVTGTLIVCHAPICRFTLRRRSVPFCCLAFVPAQYYLSRQQPLYAALNQTADGASERFFGPPRGFPVAVYACVLFPRRPFHGRFRVGRCRYQRLSHTRRLTLTFALASLRPLSCRFCLLSAQSSRFSDRDLVVQPLGPSKLASGAIIVSSSNRQIPVSLVSL
jgi:hypothetical protein